MRLFHVTPASNLSSIMKSGLTPSLPKLRNHRLAFTGDNYPQDITYAWYAKNTKQMSKIAKDVAYWHVWGWRINRMLDEVQSKDPHEYDIMVKDPAFGHRRNPPVVDETLLVLVLSNIANESCFGGYEHGQIRKMTPAYDIKRRRVHREPMALIADVVPPENVRPWALVWTETTREGRKWDVKTRLRRLR